MTRFVIVPQWQGSSSTRAMLLAGGAEAIAGDLPRSACTVVDVPLEAGESWGTGTRRLSSLTRTRERITEALPAGAERVLVVGGDSGVAVPTIAAAAKRHPDLRVVWFSARAGLHSPATSPTGAYADTLVRNLFEDGDLPAAGISADAIVLAGVRDIDDVEHAAAEAAGVRRISAAELVGTIAGPVHVHVDLDVLDPSAISGLTSPVPFGLAPAELTSAIGAVRADAELVSASLSGFAPASAEAAVDDLGVILRIIGALA